MDRLPEHTFFPSSALLGKKLQSDSDERINALERALRDVAALPYYISPVVALAHDALAAFERVHTSGAIGDDQQLRGLQSLGQSRAADVKVKGPADCILPPGRRVYLPIDFRRILPSPWSALSP